jgi:hypothetical protein
VDMGLSAGLHFTQNPNQTRRMSSVNGNSLLPG